MDQSFASYVVRVIFTNSPYLLGLFLGAVVAIMGWSRAPKAAMAVLAGVVVSGLGWFVSPFLTLFIRNSTIDMVFILFSNIAQGAGFVFVCAAAFLDRRPPDPLDKSL